MGRLKIGMTVEPVSRFAWYVFKTEWFYPVLALIILPWLFFTYIEDEVSYRPAEEVNRVVWLNNDRNKSFRECCWFWKKEQRHPNLPFEDIRGGKQSA